MTGKAECKRESEPGILLESFEAGSNRSGWTWRCAIAEASSKVTEISVRKWIYFSTWLCFKSNLNNPFLQITYYRQLEEMQNGKWKFPQNALKSSSILPKPVCVGSYFRYKSHIHTQQIHPLNSSFQVQKIGCQLFKNFLLHISVEEKRFTDTCQNWLGWMGTF